MADLFSNPLLAKGRDRALTVYRSHRVRKTLLILAIVVVGSLWVLHNMNENMMHPTSQMMPVE